MVVLPQNPYVVMLLGFLTGVGVGVGSEIGKWFFERYTRPVLEETHNYLKERVNKGGNHGDTSESKRDE